MKMICQIRKIKNNVTDLKIQKKFHERTVILVIEALFPEKMERYWIKKLE